jgi:hypothetical protein
MKATRIIFYIISGALLGLFLYAIGTHVMTKGYLVPWQKLASPPARLAELVLSTPATVYGRTSDNTTSVVQIGATDVGSKMRSHRVFLPIITPRIPRRATFLEQRSAG